MLTAYNMLGRFDAILGRWRDVDRFLRCWAALTQFWAAGEILTTYKMLDRFDAILKAQFMTC